MSLQCEAYKKCKTPFICYHMKKHERVVNCHAGCSVYDVNGPTVECKVLIPRNIMSLLCEAHLWCKIDFICYHRKKHKEVANCHVGCNNHGGPTVMCEVLIPTIEHDIITASIEYHFKWLSENA
ncbi:hypothetical protein LCGC14_1861970 [marine sediment metagenome]|uniref:Uncharacterized protein n=1 Tax=marine sediment metagenome TaxID=412755 RepID=A0A0F9GVN5_9ZZZZ